MRVAILSDIHGNQVALDSVLEDVARQPDIQQIVIAGDLCLNGPRPREVLETIRALYCPVIQGNVDVDVAAGPQRVSAKKRDTVVWTREQIGQDGIDYLASLPTAHVVTNPEGSDLLVVHANPLNMEDHIAPNSPDEMLEHLLDPLPSTIGAMAFGHLHIAFIRRWRHLLLVDTGSCGLPRDGDGRASYAILSWNNGTWEAEHRRVPYDVKYVVKQFKSSDIPNVDKRIKVLLEAKY